MKTKNQQHISQHLCMSAIILIKLKLNQNLSQRPYSNERKVTNDTFLILFAKINLSNKISTKLIYSVLFDIDFCS